jgi:hypothetical protein
MMSGFPFGKRRRRPSWPATATGAALSPALCRVPHPGSDPLDLYANGRFCANASTAAQIGAAFPPPRGRSPELPRTAAVGHEDAFPRPTLSARYRFGQGTFAGTRGNERDAP